MLGIFLGRPWAIWALFAVVFLVLELALPYFACLFISISSVASAIVAASGWNQWLQLATFGAVLLLGLIFLRPSLVRKALDATGVPHRADQFLGKQTRVTVESHGPSSLGRVLILDQDWAVSCDSPLQVGDRVEVTGTDGIVLMVRKIEGN